jgi:predicted DCC family thiol-disulfide oxidoreductase YuxK
MIPPALSPVSVSGPPSSLETASPKAGSAARFWTLLFAKICIALLVLIPKGGFKLGPAPITWSYLMLGGCSVLCLIAFTMGGRLVLPKRRVMALLLTIPLGCVTIGGFLANGAGSPAYFVGFLIASFILPLLLVFFIGYYFDRSEDLPELLHFMKNCIFVVACYGIVLFTFFSVTKRTFEIPFVTTNGSEEKAVEQKHNLRGDVMKLVATYNNGNIYGVSTLILFPLFRILERRTWRLMVVRIALLLTLSRTVWLGLFLAEFFYIVFQTPVTAKRAVGFLAIIGLAVGGVAGVMAFLGKNITWIFDSRLGGRRKQFEVLNDPTFFPSLPFSGTGEMTYLGVINELGVAGLLSFLVLLAAPLLALVQKGGLNRVQTAALCGCMIYWCVAFLDGAYVLIPVMAFFWMATSLAICNNPALADV